MTSPRLSARRWQSWDLNPSCQAQHCLVELGLLLPVLLCGLPWDGRGILAGAQHVCGLRGRESQASSQAPQDVGRALGLPRSTETLETVRDRCRGSEG